MVFHSTSYHFPPLSTTYNDILSHFHETFNHFHLLKQKKLYLYLVILYKYTILRWIKEKFHFFVPNWARSTIFLTNLCTSLGEGSIGKCGELSYRAKKRETNSLIRKSISLSFLFTKSGMLSDYFIH